MKREIIKYINSCKFNSDIFRDYYGGNKTGFNHDKREHDTARSRARNLLIRIKRMNKEKFLNACRNAWGGRVSFNGNELEYCPGQFYDLEKPQAIAEVLEYYINN